MPPDAAQGPATALPRETAVENALGRGGVLQGSAFGGYGELTLNVPGKYVLDSPPEATIDLRRFVLFFGHNFSDRLRFYSEFEVEHAVSSADDRGEAEVEQAYLDGLLSRRVNLRGGLMIMPGRHHQRLSRAADVQRRRPPRGRHLRHPDDLARAGRRHLRRAARGRALPALSRQRLQRERLHRRDRDSRRPPGGAARARRRLGRRRAPRLGAAPGHGVRRVGVLRDVGQHPDQHGRQGAGQPVRGRRAHAHRRVHGARRGRVAVHRRRGRARRRSRDATARGRDPRRTRSRRSRAAATSRPATICCACSRRATTSRSRCSAASTTPTRRRRCRPASSANPAFRRTIYTAGLMYRPVMQIGLKLDYRRHEFGAGPSGNELAAAITWMF